MATKKQSKMQHAATTIVQDIQHDQQRVTPKPKKTAQKPSGLNRARAAARASRAPASKKATPVKDARAIAKAKGNPIPTRTREEQRTADLNDRARLVTMSKTKGGVSRRDFADAIGTSDSRASRLIRGELEAGTIVAEGSARNLRYVCRKLALRPSGRQRRRAQARFRL